MVLMGYLGGKELLWNSQKSLSQRLTLEVISQFCHFVFTYVAVCACVCVVCSVCICINICDLLSSVIINHVNTQSCNVFSTLCCHILYLRN